MSKYKLPEGNVQISFSGGRTSAFMLHQIIDANNGLPDRCKVIFTNTGLEMPQTLDFVQECSKRWGIQIHWLEYMRDKNGPTYREVSYENAARNGEPFAELLRFKKFMPSPMKRFCTTELKMFTIKRFIRKGCNWDRWTQAVGIRADESHRAKKTSKDKWDYWYPLISDLITKEKIADFWKEQSANNNFDLHLPNFNGKTPSGNCDFCFLKSESSTAYMLRNFPERARWWVDIEKEIGFPFRLDRNLTNMQDFISRQGDWLFDDEAFLCQADDGECTG
jgi:3'-phosphoadenosine 5'-phosphosulfate sulfotransferase (PAPS reductase)/FAD synthetase